MFRYFTLAFLLIVTLFIWRPTLFLHSPFPFPPLSSLPTDHYQLDNGMRVVLIQHKKLPAVAHMLWYQVGSAQEKAGKTGLAHFLEHMMFQGTKRYPDDSFSHIVSLHGGDQNAFTSQDYTGYYQYIAKDYLPVVMELESERMHGLVLSQDSFLNERDVILEERRMRVENKPRSRLLETMKSRLFPDHPYGQPVIGWFDDISGLTIDDAVDFYQSYYSPQNAVLVIVGDIDPDNIKPLINTHYGSLPRKEGAISRETIRRPDYIGPQSARLTDARVETPELIRYYLAPSRHTDGKRYSHALEILSYYLGGSDTGMLYQKLVRDKKIASHVSVSYNDVALGHSIFSIHVLGYKDSSIESLEEALDQELAELLTHDIHKNDLRRIQSMLYNGSLYNRDSFKYIAQLYGYILASDLPIHYVDEWPRRIVNTTVDDVSEAAHYVLKPSGAMTGFLLPKKLNIQKDM